MPILPGSTDRRAGTAAWSLGIIIVGLLLAGCVQNPGAAGGPFPAFAEFEGDEVGEILWAGEPTLPRDSLEAVTVVDPPLCPVRFLPRSLCIGGVDRYRLRLNDLAGDLVRLQLYFRDHGYYEARIVPSVEPMGVDEVSVRFTIVPGDRVLLRELAIEGEEEVVPEEQLRRGLSLRVGEPFRRVSFLASADTLRTLLQRRGHAYAEILRNFSIDTIANSATATYVAIPGPVVTVDSILIVGADRLDRSTVLNQINVRQGRILSVPDLGSSQRNLYQLSIVSFATVEMAPDSLQLDSDSTSATVMVRVVEAAKYLLNGAAGYGSIDCFRTGTRLTDRNFLGGGRTLELSGSAAKIGVGYPLDLGLESSLCRGLENDPFSDELTYRVAAAFAQPRLLGTRTSLSLDVRAERRAELTLFLRESVGSQLTVSRDVGSGMLVGAGVQVERGQTESTAAVFCVIFRACTEDEALSLQEPRWSNAVTLSGALDRTTLVGAEARGYQARLNFAWASSAFGSADQYLSALGEVVGYYPLRPGWTLSGRIQGGQFLTGAFGLSETYIPPERRFYAGGPNTVRGFAANALGPQAYVTDQPDFRTDVDQPDRYPLGGTQVLVASAEVNTPSPFLPQYLRFAAFVDAGQVWAAGLGGEEIVGADPEQGAVLVTPGIGIRFATPVGPIRVDMGYNAYDLPAGPLYLTPEEEDEGQLIFFDDYQPPSPSFLDRLQIHIAVGQAF